MKKPQALDIALVIPAFNEALRWTPLPWHTYLLSHPYIHLVLVDDGSTDATLDRFCNLRSEFPYRIKVLRLDSNAGKAEAVRLGILTALKWKAFFAIGYWDADLSTPLKELEPFIQHLHDHPSCGLVMGMRKQGLTQTLKRKWIRHLSGRCFAFLVNSLWKLPYYDTQCGAKLMTTPMAQHISQTPFVSRWLGDLEILLRLGPDREIKELALRTWIHKENSKISPWQAGKILREIVRVYRYYK